jgi:hypothetical protein
MTDFAKDLDTETTPSTSPTPQPGEEASPSIAAKLSSAALSGLESAKIEVSRRLTGAADLIKEKAPDGMLHDQAVSVSQGLEHASSYLSQTELKELRQDFVGVLRRHPLLSLGAAFGVGMLLGRPRLGRSRD